jgi:tetratricopeptide (TPR) repeat protein
VDEFLARCRRGERPAPTEYAARHPDLADQIRELFPALQMLEDVRPAPQPAAGAPPPVGPLRRLGEYRIVREIGRGGMGVVYEAEQESLGRRVALKVLPPGALGDAQHVERFQREARAAARLHHTNIVPIFAVGEEGGTHYYVMQYIEGQPLDDVLAELRRLRAEADPRAGPEMSTTEVPSGDGPTSARVARSLWQGPFRPARPPDGGAAAGPDESPPPGQAAGASAPLPPGPGPPSGAAHSSGLLSDPQCPFAKRVAQLGVQVADALEYATEQGVLHRDIKPANLLLDVWGTVWLTDFGLAKATGTPDLTRPGDLVGTLRYLAPERFHGRADVRSDVYALGLTLYEMLALQPAFDGRDQAEVARQITTAAPPRLDRIDPRLPRDLVTIVHKAMAKDPGDRYQTAAALADDLRRFLDDRSIVARRTSLPEQAWRWCRRNPTMAALVAAVLALLLVATGGGVWLARQHAEGQAAAARRDEELRKEVGAALAQAAGFRKGFHFREARLLLEQAGERLEPAGPDDLRRQVDQAWADLDLAEHLDAARLQATTLDAHGYFAFFAAQRRYMAAFAEAGLGREGDDIAAVAARVRDSAVRAEIVAALDDWASITQDRARRPWLLAVARAADPDSSRDRLRQPELWQDGPRLARVADELRAAELSPQLATALGRVLIEGGGEAVPLLAAAQERFPQDFWINFELGLALYRARRWDEALSCYRAALALRPETSVVHINLGTALHHKGWLDEAIRHYQQAIRLGPKFALAYNNIGEALRDKGRLDEAIDHYQEAIRIDPKYALAYGNLADALREKGLLEEAIDHYQQALQLDPKWVVAHNNLGVALRARGRLEEAIDHFQQAIRLDPKDALAHSNLGDALRIKGRLDEAIDQCQHAVRLDPKFALAYSNLGEALRARGRLDEGIGYLQQALWLDPESVLAHNNLGVALQSKGRLDEAIGHYHHAIRLDPKDAMAYSNLADALRDKGRLDEAIDHYQQSLRLDPKLAAAHLKLADALQAKGRLDEAIDHFQQALQLGPKSAAAHLRLADALQAKGRLDEAIGHYQESLRLDPESVVAHNNLGFALRAKGRLDEAIGHYQEATRLDPKSALAHNNLGVGLQAKGRLDEAIDQYQQALGLDPEFALAHNNLGLTLQAKGRYAEAIGHFQEAAWLEPKSDVAYRNLDSCLYAAAYASVRAATGQGPETVPLGEPERAGRRRQALDWLRARLELRAKLRKDGKVMGSWLTTWQTDPALAGVRDPEALAKLPDAERAEWQQFWKDVAALLAADPLEQGRVFAARRDWAKAADCYARALEHGATDHGHVWFEYAAVLLLSGDRPGYAKACARMVERCGKASDLRAYHVARACTLAPDAVADPSLPGKLAEEELKAKEFWSLTEKGALHYRAGRFNQAVPLFERSLRADPKFGRAVVNWLWLALAEQRLGNAEEARRWLTKAQAWLDQYGDGLPARADEKQGLHLHNWLEAHILRAEAEALLGTGPAQPTEPDPTAPSKK